jgi:hypothetical protein
LLFYDLEPFEIVLVFEQFKATDCMPEIHTLLMEKAKQNVACGDYYNGGGESGRVTRGIGYDRVRRQR